jgi:hypothetical protein
MTLHDVFTSAEYNEWRPIRSFWASMFYDPTAPEDSVKNLLSNRMAAMLRKDEGWFGSMDPSWTITGNRAELNPLNYNHRIELRATLPHRRFFSSWHENHDNGPIAIAEATLLPWHQPPLIVDCQCAVCASGVLEEITRYLRTTSIRSSITGA